VEFQGVFFELVNNLKTFAMSNADNKNMHFVAFSRYMCPENVASIDYYRLGVTVHKNVDVGIELDNVKLNEEEQTVDYQIMRRMNEDHQVHAEIKYTDVASGESRIADQSLPALAPGIYQILVRAVAAGGGHTDWKIVTSAMQVKDCGSSCVECTWDGVCRKCDDRYPLENGKCVITCQQNALGCFKDNVNNRAIATLEGTDPRLDGDYRRRNGRFEKCQAVACELGYPGMALQNGGWCASSPTALDTYDKYGEASNCPPNEFGGAEKNMVYQLIQGFSCPTDGVGAFHGELIASKSTDSWQQCAAACTANPRCLFWTWVKADANKYALPQDRYPKLCDLMRRFRNTLSRDSYVSGHRDCMP